MIPRTKVYRPPSARSQARRAPDRQVRPRFHAFHPSQMKTRLTRRSKIIGGGGIGSLTWASTELLISLAPAPQSYRNQGGNTDQDKDRGDHQRGRQPSGNALSFPDRYHDACDRPGCPDEEPRDEVCKRHKPESLRGHRITEGTKHLTELGAASQTPAYRHQEPRSPKQQEGAPGETSQQPRDRGDDPHQHQSEAHDERRRKAHQHRLAGASRILCNRRVEERVELDGLQQPSSGGAAPSLSVVVFRTHPPCCVGQYCHHRPACPNSPVLKTSREACCLLHQSDWSRS